ncbi:MAG: acyloxyacyl hydrolase [Bacteroidia bacterium]|nr:acyloxyacyl hydrolase [Bacteroidia bacterium]
MERKFKLYLVIVINILVFSQSYAQEESRLLRLGFNYGVGKQQLFPFNSPDYSYNVNGYKVLINYPLKKSGVFSYELQLEPGIYLAKHQLLNEYYVQPKDGADYLEQREIFTKEETITEYVLNVGFLVRYNLKGRLSFFILGSIGPMISDTETERVARGFAFSDIITFGAAYKVGKIMFEIRPGLRHVSNANLQYPNSGHNSSNIDFGISVFPQEFTHQKRSYFFGLARMIQQVFTVTE